MTKKRILLIVAVVLAGSGSIAYAMLKLSPCAQMIAALVVVMVIAALLPRPGEEE